MNVKLPSLLASLVSPAFSLRRIGINNINCSINMQCNLAFTRLPEVCPDSLASFGELGRLFNVIR